MKRTAAVVLVLLTVVSAVPALGATDGEPTGFLRMVAQYFRLRTPSLPAPTIGGGPQTVGTGDRKSPRRSEQGPTGQSCTCTAPNGRVFLVDPPEADWPACTCCFSCAMNPRAPDCLGL